MSRQNKNARNRKAAKDITAMHKSGNKGPAKTVAKHGKKRENTLWFKNKMAVKARQLSLAEQALQNEL